MKPDNANFGLLTLQQTCKTHIVILKLFYNQDRINDTSIFSTINGLVEKSASGTHVIIIVKVIRRDLKLYK